MKRVVSICLSRPVTVFMVFSAILLFGLIAAASIPVRFLPEITVPKLMVSAEFSGLPPAEIRELLAVPLEDAFSSLNGIKTIKTVCRQGFAAFELTFHWGTDMVLAGVEARETIDIVYPLLPSECKKPTVVPLDPGNPPAAQIAVFPERSSITDIRRLCKREIKTALQQLEGVGSIIVWGGTEEEISVAVDAEQASRAGIALTSIHRTLRETNIVYPVGSLTEAETEYPVKADARVNTVDDLGKIIISAPGRSVSGNSVPPTKTVTLGDIADIRRAKKKQQSLCMVNGRECVLLTVRPAGGESPVELSRELRREMNRLERNYGHNLDFQIVDDSSELITSSIRSLLNQSVFGLAAAFIVLFIFIRKTVPTLLVIVSFPVSILFTLLLLLITGRTLNLISLGGMALGIGMVVDNGIVVMENLVRATDRTVVEGIVREKNESLRDVIAEAVSEVGRSTFGSTATTLVVFVPVIYLPGIIGSLYTDLALSVIFSLSGSFLCSMTLIPVLFYHSMKKSVPLTGNRVNRLTFTYAVRFMSIYRKVLSLFLRKPFFVIIFICGLISVAAGGFGSVDFAFFDEIDERELTITALLPSGTTMEKRKEIASELFDRLGEFNFIKTGYLITGKETDDPYYLLNPENGGETVYLTVKLNPDTEKRASEYIPSLREALRIRNAEVHVTLPNKVPASLLGIGSSEQVILVTGQSPNGAHEKAKSLKQKLLALSSNHSIHKPELDVALRPSGSRTELQLYPIRDSLSKSALTQRQITSTVRIAVEGSVPTTIEKAGEEIDIRLTAVQGQATDMARLTNLPLVSRRGGPAGGISGTGSTVPLGSVITFVEKQTTPILLRKNRKDVAELVVEKQHEPKFEVEERIKHIVDSIPYAHSVKQSIFHEHFIRLLFTLLTGLLLLYLLLGIQFESFLTPLCLITTFPLSLSGVCLALLISGERFTLNSGLGIIVLLGIVINNAIILFETYERKRNHGYRLLPAVRSGTTERLRPVLMTMLTTVAALTPLAIDPADRSSQSGLAVVVLGGLLISTVVTLFIFPAAYTAIGKGGRS